MKYKLNKQFFALETSWQEIVAYEDLNIIKNTSTKLDLPSQEQFTASYQLAVDVLQAISYNGAFNLEVRDENNEIDPLKSYNIKDSLPPYDKTQLQKFILYFIMEGTNTVNFYETLKLEGSSEVDGATINLESWNPEDLYDALPLMCKTHYENTALYEAITNNNADAFVIVNPDSYVRFSQLFASIVANDSSVDGATVKDALEDLERQIEQGFEGIADTNKVSLVNPILESLQGNVETQDLANIGFTSSIKQLQEVLASLFILDPFNAEENTPTLGTLGTQVNPVDMIADPNNDPLYTWTGNSFIVPEEFDEASINIFGSMEIIDDSGTTSALVGIYNITKGNYLGSPEQYDNEDANPPGDTETLAPRALGLLVGTPVLEVGDEIALVYQHASGQITYREVSIDIQVYSLKLEGILNSDVITHLTTGGSTTDVGTELRRQETQTDNIEKRVGDLEQAPEFIISDLWRGTGSGSTNYTLSDDTDNYSEILVETIRTVNTNLDKQAASIPEELINYQDNNDDSNTLRTSTSGEWTRYKFKTTTVFRVLNVNNYRPISVLGRINNPTTADVAYVLINGLWEPKTEKEKAYVEKLVISMGLDLDKIKQTREKFKSDMEEQHKADVIEAIIRLGKGYILKDLKDLTVNELIDIINNIENDIIMKGGE